MMKIQKLKPLQSLNKIKTSSDVQIQSPDSFQGLTQQDNMMSLH